VQENRSDEIGVNPEFTPACDLVCPTGARVFGDIDNPDSEVSKKISSKRATQLKKHFGTKPQVYYVIDGGE